MTTSKLYALATEMAGWSGSAHTVELAIQPVAVYTYHGSPTGEAPGQHLYTVAIEVAGHGTKVKGSSRDGVHAALRALCSSILEYHVAQREIHQKRYDRANNLFNQAKDER